MNMKEEDDFKAYEGMNPLPKYLNNKRLNFVVKFAGEVDSVLDAGCGDGYVLTKINAKKFTGIDLVESKLLRASEKRSAARTNIIIPRNKYFICALPFPLDLL